MLHTIWRIESILASAAVMKNEKTIWENRLQELGKLDHAEALRLASVSSDWDRLKEHVPVMEAELKKLKDDLELGRMEIPQAVLERLQGHREIPMSQILQDAADLQETPMEDITNTHE
jgi:hypothetical protein